MRTSLYEWLSRSKYGWEILEGIATSAERVSVRYKALDILANTPEEIYRRKPGCSKERILEHLICSNDPRVAIRAVDLLVGQVDKGTYRERSSLASDAIFAGIREIEGNKIKTIKAAKQPVVEYAFDLYVDSLEESERALNITRFLEKDGWLSSRGQSFPPGLLRKSMGYLESHMEDIAKISWEEKKGLAYHNLAWRGSTQEIRETGIDGLAQGFEKENSIRVIGELFSDSHNTIPIHEDAEKRVEKWACIFVRGFAALEDKKLARSVLGKLARDPNESDLDNDFHDDFYGFYPGQCPGYKVKLLGEERPVHEIAREELTKVPSKEMEKKSDLLKSIS